MEIHLLTAIAVFALTIPPSLWLWDRHTGQYISSNPEFIRGYEFGLSLAGQTALRYVVERGMKLKIERGEFSPEAYGCACALAALDNKPRPRPWKQSKTTAIVLVKKPAND